jgi:hypothetical protein
VAHRETGLHIIDPTSIWEMTMALRMFLLLSVLFCVASAQEPDTAKEQRMQWFADAKL